MDVFLDLEKSAMLAQQPLAILAPGRPPLAYSSLWQRVTELRKSLAAAGLFPGHPLALVFPDGPDFLVALLAATDFGPCAPLDPGASQQEYQAYFSHLRAPTLITPDDYNSPAIAAAMAQGMEIVRLGSSARPLKSNCQSGAPRETSAALLMFTSSTSGRPKLVPLTTANVEISCRNEARALELTSEDRLLNLTPQFNFRGLRASLSQLSLGGGVACVPRFEPASFPQWLKEFKPTWISVSAAGLGPLCSLSRQIPGLWRSAPLRFIRTGGTAPDPELLRELEALSGVPVLDGYGATETGCVTRSTVRSRKAGSVGRSVGTEIAILDEAGNILGPSTPGEIAVRGPNVVSGYLDDAEANARAFRAGWFHTRDLGYLDDDGFLFLTGRIDEVINRGGQKVLPQEVEAALRGHPAVKEAAVFGVAHKTLGHEVAAAVVLNSSSIPELELRMFAAGRLTSYKVPHSIMFVEDLPRTATGKLQRKVLAHSYRQMIDLEQQRVDAPATETEKAIAAMWEKEFRRGPIGRDADFSRLGGDSLTAALVGTEIQATLGINLDLRAFVEYPKLREFSRVLDELRRSGRGDLEALEYAPRTEPLPMSFTQERTWKYSDSLNYNITFPHLFRGPLDHDALRSSMAHVAQCHEILRTTYNFSGGTPVQVVHPVGSCELQTMDFSHLADPDRQARLIVEEEARKPFDLERGPLMRYVLVYLGVRRGRDEHLLIRSNHHIMADAQSLKIYFRQLACAYLEFVQGRTPQIPDVQRIEYGDYALWQRKEWSPEGQPCRDAVAWWAGRFSQLQAPAPPLHECMNRLTSDTRTRAEFAQPSDGVLHWGIDAATSSRLQNLQTAEGVNFFGIRLAAFSALVAEVVEQTEVILGVHFSYRNRLEWQNVMGDFANLITLPIAADPALTFRETVRNTHHNASEASAHGEIPHELLREQLQARGVTPPAVGVLFHSSQQKGPVSFGDDLEMSWLSRSMPVMPWGFSIFMDKHNEDRSCVAMFDANLYEPPAVHIFVDRFARLLDAASRYPDRTMSSLLASSR